MRAVYTPLTQSDWERIIQHGGFQGFHYQRGSGLGSAFRSLMRTIMPVAKVVGKQVLGIGADVAADVARGSSVKKATRKVAKHVVSDNLHKVQPIKGRRIRKKPVTHFGRVP